MWEEEGIEVSEKSTIQRYQPVLCFCRNIAGEILPLMIVYKAKFLYHGWVSGDPKGTIYDSTDSGWFDRWTFKWWFKELFVPNLNGGDPFANIGNNLGSHFNKEVIKLCSKRNICFITLALNSTHICQHLDLSVFGPMKRIWRKEPCE